MLGILIRESHQRTVVLEDTICEMKTTYAGALPMESVERYNSRISSMKEEKQKLEDQKSTILTENSSLADNLVTCKIEMAARQEMISQLQIGSKTAEIDNIEKWQKKIEMAKLAEERMKRQLGQIQEENKSLQGQNGAKEQIIQNLEEEIILKRKFSNQNELLKSRLESVIAEIEENIFNQKRKRFSSKII